MSFTRLAIALILTIQAGAAQAEKFELDHRLHKALHEAIEHPSDETVFYDPSNPARLFDRILITGKSAERDWQEALELVVLKRDRKLHHPADWYGAFPAAGESACPARSTILARDETSLTFALEAQPCATGPAFTGLYRVFYGKKSVYLAAGKYKGVMTPDQRAEWLALLASARVKK